MLVFFLKKMEYTVNIKYTKNYNPVNILHYLQHSLLVLKVIFFLFVCFTVHDVKEHWKPAISFTFLSLTFSAFKNRLNVAEKTWKDLLPERNLPELKDYIPLLKKSITVACSCSLVELSLSFITLSFILEKVKRKLSILWQ